MTREQAALLADLLRTVRNEWDTRAITAALANVRDRELADVAYAAIVCAEDSQMRTPAAIGFLDAKHWRPTVRESETPAQRQARIDAQAATTELARQCNLCDEAGWLPSGVRCPHDGLTPAERAARVSERAAAARAAIRRPKLASIGRPQVPAEPPEPESPSPDTEEAPA